MTASRRISRRRLRLLLGRLQPPRPVWRSLAIMPMLLLVSLLGLQGSGAWFTSGQNVPSPLHSGDWASLMNPDTASALSFTGFAWDNTSGRFTISGLVWNGYSGSFSVTSQAGVPLPMRLIPDTGGPTVMQGTTVLTPSDFVTINPGETLTFTLTGEFASWSGNLEVAIGANRYDWITVPLTVQAQPHEISTVITVDAPTRVFCSGTAAPKFDDLTLMTIKKAQGMHSIPLTVTMSQYNALPLDGPGPHDDLIVQLLQPTPTTLGTPWIGTPATTGTPTVGAFSTSSSSYPIRVRQGDTDKGNPTTVTITLSSTSSAVTGSKSYEFVLAHPNSEDCPLHGNGGGNTSSELTPSEGPVDSVETTSPDQTDPNAIVQEEE